MRYSLGELIEKGLVSVVAPGENEGDPKGVVMREKKRVTIHWVIDAMTKQEIAADEARRRDIINMDAMTYTNTRTGEVLSFQEAIDRGLMKADGAGLRPQQKVRSVKETKSYCITGAIDPNTGVKIDVATALARGVIDQANGMYVGREGHTIPISEGIKTRAGHRRGGDSASGGGGGDGSSSGTPGDEDVCGEGGDWIR